MVVRMGSVEGQLCKCSSLGGGGTAGSELHHAAAVKSFCSRRVPVSERLAMTVVGGELGSHQACSLMRLRYMVSVQMPARYYLKCSDKATSFETVAKRMICWQSLLRQLKTPIPRSAHWHLLGKRTLRPNPTAI